MANLKKKKTIVRHGLAFVSVCFVLGLTSCSSRQTERSIETLYPTKDWVISDYIVTDSRFGAKAEPGFDNRAAFQAAIDSAYNRGGGVVYVPAGNYEFHTTQVATKQVRVRQDDEETNRTFEYEYVLKLPAGVQLRGDWAERRQSAWHHS